jgi:hypothetical protein
VFPAQSPVLGGVGVNLGPIETDLAEFQDTHLLGNEQNLNEERLQLRKKPLAEGGDRIVVGMIVGSNVAKSDRIVGSVRPESLYFRATCL